MILVALLVAGLAVGLVVEAAKDAVRLVCAVWP